MMMKLRIAGIVIILFLLAILIWWRRHPRKLKIPYFEDRWKILQKLCSNQHTWPQAIMEADRLLDEALKRRRFKGGSMGERLVSAQRFIDNNDGVWFAHNLCKKLLAEADLKLKQVDVKEALMGFRQALKNLGAFDDK